MSRRLMILLGLLPAFDATVAQAGTISPGETQTLSALDAVPPAGTALATRVASFDIPYTADAGVSGTLTSAVYATPGGMTFVYDVDLSTTGGVSGAGEGSELTVGAFGDGPLDVLGAFDFESEAPAARSADGSTVLFSSDSPGLGGAPRLIITVPGATAYDAKGVATFYAADELFLPDGSGDLGRGIAEMAGVLQPTLSGPAPAPVPLPPAAYTGLGMLLGLGVIGAARRKAA